MRLWVLLVFVGEERRFFASPAGFRFIIGIEEEPKFRVCRRLLGPQGQHMKDIAQRTEVGGEGGKGGRGEGGRGEGGGVYVLPFVEIDMVYFSLFGFEGNL